MDRIVGFVLIAWLVVIGSGVVVALLPVLAFAAGFVGVIVIFAFLGRLVAGLFW